MGRHAFRELSKYSGGGIPTVSQAPGPGQAPKRSSPFALTADTVAALGSVPPLRRFAVSVLWSRPQATL
jgi:hypothetical protein